MKRILSLFLAIILGVHNVFAMSVSAESAVVIDGDTLEILYSKNENEVMSMASTTKIMTAIIALEYADLEREITVKKEYTLVEGSSMYLVDGEVLNMMDLIYGLMLMSGNDSAVAIAHETTGDYDEFISLMNEKCEQLGLENTSFSNPNGLDDENHYTTASELAKISAYALQNEKFCQIVSSKYYETDGRTMKNHNKMLWLLEESIGIKTGYTKKSGRCLVSACEQDGKKLIAVTLNAPSDWADHTAMFEECFLQYDRYNIHNEGDIYKKMQVNGGNQSQIDIIYSENVNLNLTEKQKENLTFTVNAKKYIYAPIKKGEIFGEIVYNIGNEEIYSQKLIYTQDIEYEIIEKMNFLEKFIDFIKNLFY